MARSRKALQDSTFFAAALEGLELQRKRIDDQIRHVRALLGRRGAAPPESMHIAISTKSQSRKRVLSAVARERIAAAQKKRWAEFRKQKVKG